MNATRASAMIAAFIPALAFAQQPVVTGIETIELGIFAYEVVISTTIDDKMRDATTNAALETTRQTVRGVKFLSQTNRIPIRNGTVYGVRFVIKGAPAGTQVAVQLKGRGSVSCHLTDGRVVSEWTTTRNIAIGVPRFLGWSIPSPDCTNEPSPGESIIEWHYGGRKLAEVTFHLFKE